MQQGIEVIIKTLLEENKLLKESIALLELTNSKLLGENQQLKERLGLNSTNSPAIARLCRVITNRLVRVYRKSPLYEKVGRLTHYCHSCS